MLLFTITSYYHYIYALMMREYKKKLDVFDHQIHQKLATDVIGVSFDAQ